LYFAESSFYFKDASAHRGIITDAVNSVQTTDRKKDCVRATCIQHANSLSCLLLQAYKGIKAILAAVMFSHIDPQTGTNPTFEALGYVPGNSFQDPAVGPPPPGAAEQEEVLATATVHMPDLINTLGSAAAVQVSM
jgi:hypothetical protein